MSWVKSSYSAGNGNCVEWNKSTYSSGGDCVEVLQPVPGNILVRDSKSPDGPILVFTGPEWEAFVAGVKDGEFDL